MAVTIKRKSLKKNSKKNVQSRKRNNKTRKNIGNIRNMKGGVKVKKATKKEKIKSALLELEEHSKKTPIEIETFKKSKEWKRLKNEAYKHIKKEEKNKNKFTYNEIKASISEMIKKKKENKPSQQSQKVVIPEELVMKNLEIPEVLRTLRTSQTSQKVANTEPFNPKDIVLSKKMRFLNNSTREFVTLKVLEEINKQPEGSIIKHSFNPIDHTIFFYAMKPKENNAGIVNLENPFGAFKYDTKIFTPLTNVSIHNTTKIVKKPKNRVLTKREYNQGSEQNQNLSKKELILLENRFYNNPGNSGNSGKKMVVLSNKMYSSGLIGLSSIK